MTNIIHCILFASIACLIVATGFALPMAAGGAAVIMTVGLVYAYVVAKREEQTGELLLQNS